MNTSLGAAVLFGERTGGTNSPSHIRGVKEHAWLGVPADCNGRLMHHHDKVFKEAFDRR